MKKSFFIAFAVCFLLITVTKGSDNGLFAGRVNLLNNNYRAVRSIGKANFSADFAFDISLIYNSRSVREGLFGSYWKSPQLESRFFINEFRTASWRSLSGKQIEFIQDNDNDNVYNSVFPGVKVEIKDTIALITTKNKIYTYKNSRLIEIKNKFDKKISFEYQNNNLIKISQNGITFVSAKYSNDLISKLTLNGFEYNFDYKSKQVVLKKVQLQLIEQC